MRTRRALRRPPAPATAGDTAAHGTILPGRAPLMAAIHGTMRSAEERTPADHAADDRVTEWTIILLAILVFALLEVALLAWLVR
jgi:hypothetical protein